MNNFDLQQILLILTIFLHWSYIPLAFGIGLIYVIMESVHYHTMSLCWKSAAQFWMKIFTIILEASMVTGLLIMCESCDNYSYNLDIKNIAICIFIFITEILLILVILFGRKKMGKNMYLAMLWLAVITASIIPLWILSEGSIMQLLYMLSSSYMFAVVFVIGISSLFLLKKKHFKIACISIKLSAMFGLIFTLLSAVIYKSQGLLSDVWYRYICIYFIIILGTILWKCNNNKIYYNKWLLKLCVLSSPLVYICCIPRSIIYWLRHSFLFIYQQPFYYFLTESDILLLNILIYIRTLMFTIIFMMIIYIIIVEIRIGPKIKDQMHR